MKINIIFNLLITSILFQLFHIKAWHRKISLGEMYLIKMFDITKNPKYYYKWERTYLE